MAKFADREPGDLTVKEAIALARLGFQEERKALGIADVITRQPVYAYSDEQKAAELSAIRQAQEIIRSLRLKRPSEGENRASTDGHTGVSGLPTPPAELHG